jgi:hypothetical protein
VAGRWIEHVCLPRPASKGGGNFHESILRLTKLRADVNYRYPSSHAKVADLRKFITQEET